VNSAGVLGFKNKKTGISHKTAAIARIANHFLPLTNSSFASHANKYPDGNPSNKIKTYSAFVNIIYLSRLGLKGL